MHIAQINMLPAPPDWPARKVLEEWPSLRDIAEAVAGAGVRVSVIQAAARAEQITEAGVDYHFVSVDRIGPVARAERFAEVLAELGAELLHVHGLGFAEEAFAISRRAPQRRVLFQDHADRPPRWWRRLASRRWYAVASAVAFTAPELAHSFVQAGVLDRRMPVFAIPESSSRFTRGSRALARAETGLYGSPCVLWVGHLNRGKDPLTVLDGVARAAAQLPGLQLWCAFGNAPLLDEVRQRIECDPRLLGRVHLLGKVPHARIESLMRASDLFVSGSHAESCGYALLEAFACGVLPVVTDIPSFRALTAHGRMGYLWPCGDAARLAEALVCAWASRPKPEQLRAHFDASLSFAAVGRRWADAYAQVLGTRHGRAA